jgi:hypothetical protein
MLGVKCKVDRSISLPGYAQRIWSASPNPNWDTEVIALVASASIDTLSSNVIVGKQNKKVQVTNKPSSTVKKNRRFCLIYTESQMDPHTREADEFYYITLTQTLS